MYIPEDVLQNVRNRSNIVEVVSRYVPTLKKRGNNYVGLCPFHQEKTPSFTVSPDKQIFHCFGCHAGGNVFSFVSKIERVEFPESVQILADVLGIEIKSSKNNQNDGKAGLAYKVNSRAAELYNKLLLSDDGEKAKLYLKKRGVSFDSISRFKLGFAPDSWNFLSGQLKQDNIREVATEVGLVNSKEKDQGVHYYDKFRNRIMFPICDIKGNFVAFGGRDLGDDGPKYLNSPESFLYKKREILYALDLSKDSIRELKRAIVVEGYLDVIGCHQAGVENVVAPLGTALTVDQLKYLSRYCNEVVLMFDADSAGIKAAWKSLDLMDEVSVDLKVAMLPEGDPFDFIEKRGVREFFSIVDSAMNPIDFKIDQIISRGTDKLKIMIALFALLKKITYEVERGEYIKKISRLLIVDENTIRVDYNKYLQGSQDNEIKKHETKSNADIELDFFTRSYRDLIILILNFPDLLSKAVIDFSADEIKDDVSRNIYQKILEFYSDNKTVSVDKMFDFFKSGNENVLLSNVIKSEYNIDSPESTYTEIFINLRLREIDDKINRYINLIKAESTPNPQQYVSEIEILRREREKLADYVYNQGKS